MASADEERPPAPPPASAASATAHARLSSTVSSVLGNSRRVEAASGALSAVPTTSAAPLQPRPRNEARALESFNEASRLAFNAYINRNLEATRHFNEEEYDDSVAWCTGRVPRSEAQRSHMRLIQRSYVYYSTETNSKLGLYRRPFKSFGYRKVLKKPAIFNAVTQSHYDMAHGGE
ncbi:hypothetical protein B0J12DRAFT_705428 [Macrophomina phaseolina]|uniref:Uncharacterized protein n=1 Tax=Macrophomina phaseolina TaxID=35725 RepID=A0ABQ8FS73_9PEZI|nr:hypothetical protein B0J12DRAFT_705428 [Macrophomina phaseolina]